MDERLSRTIAGVASWEGLRQLEENIKARGALTQDVLSALGSRATELAIAVVEKETGRALDDLSEPELKIVRATAEYLGLKKRQGTNANRTIQQLKNRGLIGAAEAAVSRATPTQGFHELQEADLAELSFEQIVADHPDHFSPHAVWYARRTLGLPNAQSRPPADKDTSTQTLTAELLALLSRWAEEGGGQLPVYSNQQVANALGVGDLKTNGRFFGNVQSRIDLACFRASLPPLGCAASAVFENAWANKGRSWSFPILAFQQAARSRIWIRSDFEKVAQECLLLPAGAANEWKSVLETDEAAVRAWAQSFVDADQHRPKLEPHVASNEALREVGVDVHRGEALGRTSTQAVEQSASELQETPYFRVGQTYTREDVIRLAGDEPAEGGAWFTGYRSFDGAFYIFCGVGTGGRTGHDYGNRFEDGDLLWRGKTESRKGQPLIDAMVAPEATVHIFWRTDDRGPFTYAGHGLAVEVDDATPVGVRWRFANQDGSQRLPVETLRRATPEFVYGAVEKLLAGFDDHLFGKSTDYDLIADDGTRLPPKAVFGLALSEALGGVPITPAHFTAGETSACFRLLREAGYQVVPKEESGTSSTGDAGVEEDAEWSEGERRLVPHLRRERANGLSAAKKAQARRVLGKLACERCGLDPVAHYGTADAEACIEVHHSTKQVAHMEPGHRTTLADVQCLCANCHRLVHREMRRAM